MSKVVLDVAMSLDGFTAGPDIGQANPLGKGGERLHEWMWMAGDGPDGGVDIGFSPVNATVGGRRHRTAHLRPRRGPVGRHAVAWRPELRGHPPDQGGPARRQRRDVRLRRAGGRSPAGHGCRGDKDVLVLGAHVAGQLLTAGLLDEVRIHLVPLLLGEGTPLFAGERGELIPDGKPVAGAVTHLRYRVAKP
jgi:hypothetical protein